MDIPEACPECGSSPVTEAVYGLIRKISPELKRDLKSGRKKLMGCSVSLDSPAYGCLSCGWTVSKQDGDPEYVAAMEAMRKVIEERSEEK